MFLKKNENFRLLSKKISYSFQLPEPINTFHASYQSDYEPIRVSYHGNIHYNSIIDPYNPSVGVGLGLAGYNPKVDFLDLTCVMHLLRCLTTATSMLCENHNREQLQILATHHGTCSQTTPQNLIMPKVDDKTM